MSRALDDMAGARPEVGEAQAVEIAQAGDGLGGAIDDRDGRSVCSTIAFCDRPVFFVRLRKIMGRLRPSQRATA